MGSTTVEAPSTPAAPTTAQSMQDWIQNYPAMFQLQQQYAPQEAAQQVALAQQYAQPIGQAMKTAQEAMYPQETQITNALNQQVQQGMSSQLPDWARQSYMDTMRSQLGENAMSGVGADYMSTGLLQQQQNWQNYYRDLGLSITGRQPIATAQMPNYSNYASGYTPSSVANTNAVNYGNYANAYSSMYGSNQQAQASQNNMWSNIIGSGLGAAGTMMAFSSHRYKKNIKLWVKH